jgi:hypothetical protein
MQLQQPNATTGDSDGDAVGQQPSQSYHVMYDDERADTETVVNIVLNNGIRETRRQEQVNSGRLLSNRLVFLIDSCVIASDK